MDEVRQLRMLACEGVPVDAISQKLCRSTKAIRNKAHEHGISISALGRSADPDNGRRSGSMGS